MDASISSMSGDRSNQKGCKRKLDAEDGRTDRRDVVEEVRRRRGHEHVRSTTCCCYGCASTDVVLTDDGTGDAGGDEARARQESHGRWRGARSRERDQERLARTRRTGQVWCVETKRNVAKRRVWHARFTKKDERWEANAKAEGLTRANPWNDVWCTRDADDYVDVLMEQGTAEAVVPFLTLPDLKPNAEETKPHGRPIQGDLEKETCFLVGLLATKAEHQRRLSDCGVLVGLVHLLQKYKPCTSVAELKDPLCMSSVARRAADAITNLAHENVSIKCRVRTEGGIPPLVAHLDSLDCKAQRAAAGALRTLAFKNEENKNEIVDCGALSTLIFMLRSEDPTIHYEAVGVVGNLVHSSSHIKKRVLEEGALQPVIGLLNSQCPESRREAALLLGQFATTDPNFKIRIAQRGAIVPLIEMLTSSDLQLKEMAAFALGRLAQNADNQAGICHAGGLKPLLNLLSAENGSLQHNAAFALYGLADSEDNLAEIVREGGIQRLMEGEMKVQASKDCVQKTLKRLQEKCSGRALHHLLYLLQSKDKLVQQRTAVALAYLSPEATRRLIFLDRAGLDILLEMLVSVRSPIQQREAAAALFKLAQHSVTADLDALVLPPPPPQVYLGEQYVNNPTLSDVVFVVEGTKFYAHRIALLASSDAFRAMFDGGYRENAASDIDIPNISREVFEAMMRCIYTGTVEVKPEIAQDLLRASDQYLLDSLKRQCELAIAERLSTDNVPAVFELAEAYHAPELAKRCIVFSLEKYADIVAERGVHGFSRMVQRMMEEMQKAYTKMLSNVQPPSLPPNSEVENPTE